MNTLIRYYNTIIRCNTRQMTTLNDTRHVLVSAKQLQADVQQGNAVVFDSSWIMDPKRDGYEEYVKEHIPGAFFFDIDNVSDKSNPLPHMFPPAKVFEDEMNRCGVSNDTPVYLYTSSKCFSGPRSWFTFKYFGHENVFLLDGAIDAWKKEGFDLESGPGLEKSKIEGNYTATPNPNMVFDIEQVIANIDSKERMVMDARGEGRFTGETPEPRPGIESGHVPGAVNVPFSSLLLDDMVTYKSNEELRAVFEGVGYTPDKLVTTSCGSGVTACVISMALYIAYGIDLEQAAVYDGSWSEYGKTPEAPKELGKANA